MYWIFPLLSGFHSLMTLVYDKPKNKSLVTLHFVFGTLKNADERGFFEDFARNITRISVFSVHLRPIFKSVR